MGSIFNHFDCRCQICSGGTGSSTWMKKTIIHLGGQIAFFERRSFFRGKWCPLRFMICHSLAALARNCLRFAGPALRRSMPALQPLEAQCPSASDSRRWQQKQQGGTERCWEIGHTGARRQVQRGQSRIGTALMHLLSSFEWQRNGIKNLRVTSQT